MSSHFPKTIHYIWFGNGEHSEIQKRCMTSWRKFAQGFEIIRWDESNCDIYENLYVSQAYTSKKWAFVSDYFRFKILSKHGGVYMDTDMELHKPITNIASNGTFFAFERQDVVHAGIIGATPNHPIIIELMNSYHSDAFIYKNGNFNLVAIPMRTTKILRRHGLQLNGMQQNLVFNTVVFPANILTLDTGDGKLIAEHHYEASWSDKKRAKSYKLYLQEEYFKNGAIANFRRKLKRTVSRAKFFIIAKSPL